MRTDRLPRRTCLCLLTLALRSAVAGGAAPPVSGVVVERVGTESAPGRAGLEPGDLVVSWSGADPSAPVEGVASPFHLSDLETEQAPRGPLKLYGLRGDRPRSWTVAPGAWDLATRPILIPRLASLHELGRQPLESDKPSAAAGRWLAAAAAAREEADALQVAWFLAQAADASATAREWPQADAAYEQAIAVAKAIPNPMVAAQLLRRRAGTFSVKRDWVQAEKSYREALQLEQQRSAQNLALGATLNALGNVAAERGDAGSAQGYYDSALALREGLAPRSLPVAQTLFSRARLALTQGDLVRAEADLRQALAVREGLDPGSLDTARTLHNLGTAVRERGDLSAADDYFGRSLAIKERRAPGSMDVARTLNNLGLVAIDRGDLAAADGYLRRALDLKEKLAPGSPEVAGSLVNMGLLADDRGDLQAAEDFYRRALAISAAQDPASLGVAEGLLNLGELAQRRGDLFGAEERYQRALAIWESQTPGGSVVGTTLNNLCEVARDRGDLNVATQRCQRALTIFERLAPGTVNEAAARNALGRTLMASGALAEGAESLCRAVDALESQKAKLGGSEDTRAAWLAKYTGFYRDCLDAQLKLGRPAEALHVLERSRARSLLVLLAQRDLLFASDLPEDVARARKRAEVEYAGVQQEIGQLDSIRDTQEIEALQTRLRLINEKLEEIASRIRTISPRLASLQYPQPLDAVGVSQALDPGTLLLSYAVGRDHTVLFAVRAGGAAGTTGKWLSVFDLPVGEQELRRQVEAFRATIRRSGLFGPRAAPGSRDTFAASAAALYDTLIRPADSLIAGSQRVVIVPDGPLHTLAFAALKRGEPHARAGAAGYLIEWKPLHVVVSATVYSELKKARRDRSWSAASLAAFGDPNYSEPPGDARRPADPEVRAARDRGSDLGALPGTRQEVEGIASLYPHHAMTFLGKDATEEHAKTVGKEVRYIHFACHGLLDERIPLNSALALTLPEPSAPGRDNGLLQAWEVFEQVRIDADLVVLSACETGLGREVGGEGLVGLTRAFQYAGARSVLASLWNVADESTADLMKRFYEHLKRSGTKDESLRGAQVALIHAGLGPYHWAAFQLVGDWK